MIKLEKTEVVGWEHAIRGMRNPKNSWDRSDSTYKCPYTTNDVTCNCGENMCIGDNDHTLMMSLASGGPVHAKYRRMIVVYVDITAPLYWWKEFDTYKVGTVANSCSTMHKIHDKEFALEDFSCEHLMSEESFAYPLGGGWRGLDAVEILKCTIEGLNEARKRFLETKDKKYWWQMIQLLPSSYNQKRTIMLNYEVLVGIYKWRKNHKLDEWREFCEWIEKLPYSEIICGPKFLRKDVDVSEEKTESSPLKDYIDSVERKDFNVGEEKTESSPLKDYIDSIESIAERAKVEWHDDLITFTRIVISRGDEPLTEDEKAMLKRMWENQGIRLRIVFVEE